MQAFHEKEAAMLSGSKINFLKSIIKKPGTMATLHWHDSYELLYVRRGLGEQQINSKKFRFVPGTVSIIYPGDIHATVAASADGCEIDVLQFVPEYFGSRENLLIEFESSVIEVTKQEISELFDNISKYAYSEKADENLILSGNVFMLCGVLIKYCRDSVSVVRTTEFINDVCQYIRSVDDIRLENVSRHFGYSHEHFSRKFHSELGISYKHYCEKIKMQKFLKAFESDTASLAEVANLLGYSDTSSFIRAFKRIYGITPGAYRKLKNRSHTRNSCEK